ncbi:unnamed protein product [Rhizophagus irregularis]|nr:unnamed protein product [Rhizophagus irregularis]
MHGNNSKKRCNRNHEIINILQRRYYNTRQFQNSSLLLKSATNFVSYQSCLKQNCQNHHVITTPTILHKRLELAFLQYTVIIKLDVLYRHRLLKEQSIEVRGLQRWWAESLVKFHIRYQSPQISCPEVTCMVLANLSDCTRKEFIEIARKRWLSAEG